MLQVAKCCTAHDIVKLNIGITLQLSPLSGFELCKLKLKSNNSNLTVCYFCCFKSFTETNFSTNTKFCNARRIMEFNLRLTFQLCTLSAF